MFVKPHLCCNDRKPLLQPFWLSEVFHGGRVGGRGGLLLVINQKNVLQNVTLKSSNRHEWQIKQTVWNKALGPAIFRAHGGANHFKFTILRFWNVQSCSLPLVHSQERRQESSNTKRKGVRRVSASGQDWRWNIGKLTSKAVLLRFSSQTCLGENFFFWVLFWSKFLLWTLPKLTVKVINPSIPTPCVSLRSARVSDSCTNTPQPGRFVLLLHFSFPGGHSRIQMFHLG